MLANRSVLGRSKTRITRRARGDRVCVCVVAVGERVFWFHKMTKGSPPLSTRETMQRIRLMVFDVDACIAARRIEYIRVLTPLVPLKDLAVVQEVGDDVVVRIPPPTAAAWVAHLETRSFCETDPAFKKLHDVKAMLEAMLEDMHVALKHLDKRGSRLDAAVNEHVKRAEEGGVLTTLDIVARRGVAARRRGARALARVASVLNDGAKML